MHSRRRFEKVGITQMVQGPACDAQKDDAGAINRHGQAAGSGMTDEVEVGMYG